MKAVLQRVISANVVVDDEIIGEIGNGILLLLGVSQTDTKDHVEKLIDKITKMRIFSDDQGKTNLSITDIAGELLVVSQFTLYADTRKGNRPSFIESAGAEHAKELYEYCIKYSQNKFSKVSQGRFGAKMQVNLINDGPFTIVLDV